MVECIFDRRGSLQTPINICIFKMECNKNRVVFFVYRVEQSEKTTDWFYFIYFVILSFSVSLDFFLAHKR